MRGELDTRIIQPIQLTSMEGGLRYTQFVTPGLRAKLDTIARKYGYHPYHVHRTLELEFEHAYKKSRHGFWPEMYKLAEVTPGGWVEEKANHEVEAVLALAPDDKHEISFKKLVIKNFGIFRSATVEFSRDRAKPLTLIGGMNESGKTTLFSGILTALYGVEHGWEESRRNPPVPHTENSHRCQVETRLTFSGTRTPETTIERNLFYNYVSGAYRLVKQEVKLRFQKELIEGKEAVNEQIDSILPRSLSQYFLFDADAIRDFLGAQAEALRIGLERVLGLDVAPKLREDLEELKRRYRSDLANDFELRNKLKGIDQDVKRIQNDINKPKGKLSEYEKERVSKENELAQLDKECKRLLRFLSPEQIQYYGQLEAQRKELESAARLLSNQIQVSLKDDLVPSLLRPIVQQVGEQLDMPVHTIVRPLRETRKRAEEVFSREKYETSFLEYIFEPVKDYFDSKPAAPNVADLSGRDRNYLKKTLETGRDKTHFTRLVWQYKKTLMELGECETKIAKVRPPDADAASNLEATIAKKEKAVRDHEFAREQVERIRDQLKGMEEKIVEMDEERDRVLSTRSTAKNASEKWKRVKQFCDMITEALQAFRESKISELEQYASGMLERLSSKPEFKRHVKLDDKTFEASLVEQGEVRNFEQLSEGGKQILAMSLIAALSRVSGEKVPVIIDTPFGRLDSAYRTSLSKEFLKSVSHQVIVFSTDQELVGEYLGEIRECVGKSYQILQPDRSKKESILKEGYFG